ncbi:hypothetical protein V8C44DRAFT_319660 [Trichoderma aethiopicum]
MIPVAAGHAGCGVQTIKSAIIREHCNPQPAGDSRLRTSGTWPRECRSSPARAWQLKTTWT